MREARPIMAYFSADTYLRDLLRDIAASQKTVDVEVYILAVDSVGDLVCKALVEAAVRGVRVRVLVDGFGSHSWIRRRMLALTEQGVAVRVYHPIKCSCWLRRSPRSFSYFNRRNHRKSVTIDNHITYLGSMNFMRQIYRWRESGVRVEGAPVELMADLFSDTWDSAEGPWPRILNKKLIALRKRIKASLVVRTNQFFKLRSFYRHDLVDRILGAQSRVWLMTPYFLPPSSILAALLRTAGRADVRLVLPSQSDVRYFPWLSKLYYSVLLRAGVKIYEFTPTILHAKMVLIDSWSTIGTSNFNHRSFYRDLEVDIVLDDAKAVAETEEQFLRDISVSQEIKVGRNDEQPMWTVPIARTLLLMKTWL